MDGMCMRDYGIMLSDVEIELDDLENERRDLSDTEYRKARALLLAKRRRYERRARDNLPD